MDGFTAVVLAAGMGTRMRSSYAKVLHPLCGRPMIEHVIKVLEEAGATRIVVVVGHQAERVRQVLGARVEYAYQAEQKGTGHAVMQTAPLLSGVSGPVLITYGDTPLYRADTFREFVEEHRERQVAGSILTAVVDDPTGYGRIVRGAGGEFVRVVEQKDAGPEEQRIKEINTGTYCVQGDKLFAGLASLSPDNAQGEYYLPDLFTWLLQAGEKVHARVIADAEEALGINDRKQLAQAEAILRQRIREYWMENGVTIVDPNSTWIDPEVSIGADSILFPGTILEGKTVIGRECRIGPHAHIRDGNIGDHSVVQGCVIEHGSFPAGSTVGPEGRLAKGSVKPRCAWLFQHGDPQ